MRKALMTVLATAALGTASFADVNTAQAASLRDALTRAQRADTAAEYTQYRVRTIRRNDYGDRVVVRRDYDRRYYGDRYYYRRDNNGAALAAGIAGLATGAIIGGALAQQQQAPVYAAPSGNHAYCAQRYRSYDPASGTFLGYDGLRHPCR